MKWYMAGRADMRACTALFSVNSEQEAFCAGPPRSTAVPSADLKKMALVNSDSHPKLQQQ